MATSIEASGSGTCHSSCTHLYSEGAVDPTDVASCHAVVGGNLWLAAVWAGGRRYQIEGVDCVGNGFSEPSVSTSEVTDDELRRLGNYDDKW